MHTFLLLVFFLPTVYGSSDSKLLPLPERGGKRTRTTGVVPHVQLNIKPVKKVNKELHSRAASLPDVKKQRSVISPGTDGLWIDEEVSLENPQVIVSGREFAHIHPDGSLHLALPQNRALELSEKGWGELHPWHKRKNWEGFVMLYTPQTMEELEVTWQLLVESYNFVTGREIEN